MIMRTLVPALGLFALGGSINAVNAEDVVRVPVAAQSSDAALPRFMPSEAEFTASFAQLGAPAPVEVPAHAVDLADVEPAEELLLAEPMGSGVASWYGNELAGNRTASGERFNPRDLTAAHRTLPLGSKVRVTYQGRSVVVRINDRGPFHGNRVIDLSQAAAEQIGIRRAGSGRVDLALLAS